MLRKYKLLLLLFKLYSSIGTSLTMDQFAWSKSEALYNMGILMSVGAIVACATFLAIAPLCKRFAERHVLLWGGFLPMAIGRLLYIPWGDAPPVMAIPKNFTQLQLQNATMLNTIKNLANATNGTANEELVGCPMSQEWCLTTPALTMTQFLLGYIMTCVGYPIGVTLIQTIFSKILGPRPQGVWMGMITGAGCLSRILGPVCVGFVYTRYGTLPTFTGTAAMMIVAMAWMWLFRGRFVIEDLDKQVDGPDGIGVEMEVMMNAKKDDETERLNNR